MDCFSCKQQFNDKERVPRLFIQCGHSLCEACIIQKLQNRIITCPECNTMNFAESVNVMPKNIALLNVKRQSNVTVTVLKNSPPAKKIQNEEDQVKDEFSCQKHSKKYEESTNREKLWEILREQYQRQLNILKDIHYQFFEYKKAFCMSDKALLCINCILEENHKNHELESIQNAKNCEMKLVEKHIAKAESMKQKLINSINSIQESTYQVSKLTDKNLQEIAHFYNNIRKIVNDREEKQKSRIKEQMDREESNLNIQQKSLESVLQKIQEQSTQFKDLSNQSPILFLKNSNMRKQWIQETTIEDSALNISHSTPAKFVFNKEREVQSLIKIINSYLKHEQSKQGTSHHHHKTENNNNHNQQGVNQKAIKLNTNILTQTSSQQNAASQANQANSTPAQGAAKTNKHSNQPSLKHESKTHKGTAKEGTRKLQTQPTGGDASSQSSKAKKSFNILEDLKSEEMLDEKQQSNPKVSILNKPLKMRNQLKEKLTNEREQNRSASRDEQHYHSQGLNNKKETTKTTTDNKNKRSPISMITLNPATNPNQNTVPSVTSSLASHPKTATAGIQLTLQSNTSRGNHQSSNTTNTGSSSLSNSKNLSATSTSVTRVHNKVSPKQDSSKKQEQKQMHINIDFAQQMQQKNPHDHIGIRSNTQQNPNHQNESIEMSEIALNISEKNDEHHEHIVNNSFKGEINTFLQESSQLRTANTPNLTMIPHQQSLADTPMSAFNNSQSYGISKMTTTTYGTDVNDIYNNKLDFSSVQNANQYIYVFGGFTENQVQYTIDRYDFARNAWEQFDVMPTNRSKFCSALLMNGNILMIGGKQDNLRISSIDEYNPRFKTFLKATLQLSSPRSGFGVVYKNDMVYVIGGNDGYNILDSMELYDFVLKSVKQFPKMLEKRDELAVTQGLDGRIYAIGGFGGELNTCLNSAERYNPIYQKWEKIASLNIPRRALSAVTLPDGIYAIGGFDGNNYVNSVEKYDEQLNRWTFVNQMRFSRCTSSAVVSQNNQHIYVFGGFDNGPLDSVERYNVINGNWETLQNMPNKRFMHCCQLIQK